MSQTYDENTESKESETLPNNLKGDRDSFGRPKSDAHISVYNFVLKEERLGKYTAYSIKGTDKEGDFETRRRYSEFDKIRAVLVSRWPGVYIPPLPPKDAMHNLEAAFIEERRKRLNEFCKRVSDIPYLHYSEEFQLFIRSPPGDLERSLQAFQKIDYDDLLTKYTKSFNYLADREINNETDLKITGFKLFLTKAKGKFESLKKISRLATTAKKRYYEQLANFHSMTCVPYEKNVFSEYHLNQNAKNVFLNMEEGQEAVNEKLKQVAERESLEHINNWIENEAREIDAFLEAISYKDKYDQLRNKTQNKQKSQSDDLQKVMAGKKTLKTLFSNKPKETKISNMEKTIAAVSKDVEALNGIYDVITLVLAFDEIERFKKNKIDRYYQMLYLSSGNELLNLNSLTEYWQSILTNPNVASLSVE